MKHLKMASESYINFSFRGLAYDEDVFCGAFYAPDNGASCEFWYDRMEKSFEVWNSSKPAEAILPLPVWWLVVRLEKNGYLRETESRICY